MIVLAVALLLMPGNVYAGEYDIKIAHECPVGSVEDLMCNKFKEVVEAKSQGRIKVTAIYPANQMGDAAATLHMLRDNVLQIAVNSGGTIVDTNPEYMLFSIPGLFPSVAGEESKSGDIGRKVFSNSEFKNMLGEKLLKSGVRMFGGYLEPFYVVTSNKIIQKPEDFYGFKIRTMNSPLIIETYKKMGANPIPIPFSEVYTALQSNLADGQENCADLSEEMSFTEIQKYMLLSRHCTLSILLCGSEAYLNSLPDDLREIVLDAAAEAIEYSWTIVDVEEDKAMAVLREKGNIIFVPMTPELQEAYKEAGEVARDIYCEMVGEKEGSALLQALNTIVNTES